MRLDKAWLVYKVDDFETNIMGCFTDHEKANAFFEACKNHYADDIYTNIGICWEALNPEIPETEADYIW